MSTQIMQKTRCFYTTASRDGRNKFHLPKKTPFSRTSSKTVRPKLCFFFWHQHHNHQIKGRMFGNEGLVQQVISESGTNLSFDKHCTIG